MDTLPGGSFPARTSNIQLVKVDSCTGNKNGLLSKRSKESALSTCIIAQMGECRGFSPYLKKGVSAATENR